MASTIGMVIIGRNEGARLVRGLGSIPPAVDRVVYVDSGSTDNSVAEARKSGADVVALDMSTPFPAARARNAGVEQLRHGGLPDYIQFMDGDCELRGGWIEAAAEFLDSTPKAAAACGRLRERFPEASIYNRMCEDEWNTPVGKTRACGGIAMMRSTAFDQVGGFNPAVIAGEEPELCVRLRAAGWEIWRLDHEMAWHDAAMTRFSQWWTRARRGGFAFALGAAMHGAPPERHWVRETRRALLWGLFLPVLIVLGAFSVSAWCLLGLAIYPLQVLRLSRSMGWDGALFSVFGKFAEALGVIEYYTKRLTGRQARIIEYK
jgi:GT2 family glycosyltransferase